MMDLEMSVVDELRSMYSEIKSLRYQLDSLKQTAGSRIKKLESTMAWLMNRQSLDTSPSLPLMQYTLNTSPASQTRSFPPRLSTPTVNPQHLVDITNATTSVEHWSP